MMDKNDMNGQREVETKEGEKELKDTQVWKQFHMQAHIDSCLGFHE